MSLTPWNRQEEWYQAMIDAAGSGGGLPPVTASDAGKVLAVDNSGVWGAQEPIGKKFIVTCTPTSQDLSGTMDKTVAEISVAYEAGQEIWFLFSQSETTSHLVPVNHVTIGSGSAYPRFDASVLITGTTNMLVNISTNFAGGDSTVYSTSIYTLTPAT